MSNPVNRYIAYQQFSALLKTAVRRSLETYPDLSWNDVLPIIDKVQRHPWSGPHNVMVPLRRQLEATRTSVQERVILLRIVDSLLRNLNETMLAFSLDTSKFLNILLHGVSGHPRFSDSILRHFGVWTRDIPREKCPLLHRAAKKLIRAGWSFPDVSDIPPMWPERATNGVASRSRGITNGGILKTMTTPDDHPDVQQTAAAAQPEETSALVKKPSPYHYDNAAEAVRSMLTLAFAVRTLLAARIYGRNPPSSDIDPELSGAHMSLENAITESGSIISTSVSTWDDREEAKMALQALGWCQAVAKQAELWLQGKAATVLPTVACVSHYLGFQDKDEVKSLAGLGDSSVGHSVAGPVGEAKQIEWSPDFGRFEAVKQAMAPGASIVPPSSFFNIKSVESSENDPKLLDIVGKQEELFPTDEKEDVEQRVVDLEQLLADSPETAAQRDTVQMEKIPTPERMSKLADLLSAP